MGWYGVYKVIEEYGGWEYVPDDEKRASLRSECDPPRTLELAKAKYKEAETKEVMDDATI